MKGAEEAMKTRAYPVGLILSHHEMHEDELAAWMDGILHGQELLPGFALAQIRLIDAGLHPEVGRDGTYYLSRKRVACLGVLGGLLDEHRLYDDGILRSAAGEMANFLGTANLPALKPMLEYSLAADKLVRNLPFELAPLVKSWWLAKFGLPRVLRLYETAFRALYRNFSGEQPMAEVSTGEFRAIFGGWVEKLFSGKSTGRFRSGTDASVFFGKDADPQLEQIMKFERREGNFQKKMPFDLESIWEAIVRAGKPHEACQFVWACLNSMHIKQGMFLAARAEFNARGTYLDATTDQPYVIACVKSDNEEMKHAVSNLKIADVLYQKRSTGRFNMFALQQRFDMDPVVARLRYAEWEMNPRRGSYPSPELLYRRGTIREVPQIFSFYGAHNGTLTAPYTPISRISLEKRSQCLWDGLLRTYAIAHTPSRAQWKLIGEQKAAAKEAKEAAAQTQ